MRHLNFTSLQLNNNIVYFIPCLIELTDSIGPAQNRLTYSTSRGQQPYILKSSLPLLPLFLYLQPRNTLALPAFNLTTTLVPSFRV